MMPNAILLVFFAVLFVSVGAGVLLSANIGDSWLLILGGMTVFGFSVLRRTWALYFLVFAMLLSPEVDVAQSSAREISVRANDFLMIVIFAGWFASLALQRDKAVVSPTPLNVPILMHATILCIATLNGILNGYVGSWIAGVLFTVKLLQYYCLYFLVVNTPLTRGQCHTLLMVHLGSAFLVVFHGISQIGVASRVGTPFEAGGSSEPATLGGYLLIYLAIMIAIFVNLPHVGLRLTAFTFTGLALLPFAYTLSRASYLGFIATYLALIVVSKRRALLIPVMVLSLALIPFLLPQIVVDRMLYTFEGADTRGEFGAIRVEQSTALRLQSWLMIIERLWVSPILGFGMTGFGFIDGQYFRMIAETGLLGVSIWLILIFRVGRWTFQLMNTFKNPLYQAIAIGYFAALVGLLVHAVGTNTFIIVRIMEPFWFLAGLLHHLQLNDDVEAPAPEMKTPIRRMVA